MYHSGRRSAGGSRLPSANFRNLKTVEVGRGRNGYGFTIAGQEPCVLSCIMPSSPAEAAMLKAGDCVIAINGENVTTVDHEQFIKRIGETTGVLRLTVADMVDDGDSEFFGGSYQNPSGALVRARTSTPGIERTQMVLDELNSGALFYADPARRAHFTQQMYYGESLSDRRIVTPTGIQDKFAPGHLSPFNHSSQQIALRNNRQDDINSFWDGQSKLHIDPVTRYKNRERLRALSKRSYYVQEDPYEDGEEQRVDDDTRPLTPYELDNIAYPDLVSPDQLDTLDHMEEGDSPLVRAVVGYLGSVDIPATANLPTASLQAIRGSVRRLRVEQRVHSLMMMHISSSGIRLIGASSRVTATYPADKIVFSGICPDDKRCFGVVTVQNVSPRPEGDDDVEQIGSACHVFIVDPELCSHDMHEEISLRFSLNCMPNPETHTCVEYPASSRVVLHHVSQFYQDKRDNSHFGDFYGQSPYIGFTRRSNSGSSNSDSGFGTSGREAAPINNSDQIVDVASHIRNQRANRTMSLRRQGLSTGSANQHPGLHKSLSNHNSQTNMDYDLSGSSSPCSGELTRTNPVLKGDLEERLMPRARPHSMMAPSRHFEEPPIRSASVSVFEMSSVPQRDIRRQPLRALNLEPGWDNSLDPPLGSHHIQPTMSEPFRNGPSPHHQYLHQPRNTMTSLRRGSDCSDYNTAQQLARRNALQRAQQKHNTRQHKRNSLTASDSELNTIDEPQLRHDENTASQADLTDESPPEVGRVSGWAVSFERLLKDELGLAYFTDFLKQEFSEENILFWISCEQLSKIQNRAELKEKAETIYRRFLSSYATMPVNLEGNYRQMVERAMKDPTPEMYKDQQLQIFKLMKLDSYSRFLKSKLYQDCVLSEMGNLPMPTIENQSITELGRPERGPQATPPPTPTSAESTLEKKPKNKKAEKLVKNKLSNSFLDLRLIKTSTISYSCRDNFNKYFGKKKMAPGKELVLRPDSPNRQMSEEKKQRSLLPWFKGLGGKRVASTRTDNGRETQFYVSSPTQDQPHIPVSHSDTQIARQGYQDSVPRTRSMSQFSALFPNNVILTIRVIPDKTIGEVLLPLCEEHGLTQQTAEIFLKTTKGLIDLTQDISALGGREIVIERRVVFKIELPCKRLIGVKSKPTKKLIEVLRPVTYKYNLQLDKLVVHLNNSPIPLDLEITVAALDNQRIMVETFEQYSAGDVKNVRGNLQQNQPGTKSKENNSPVQKRANQATSEKAAMDKPPPTGGTTGGVMLVARPATVQQNNNNQRGNLRVIDEVDEASDLYRLVAKANRRRLDDQRGLTLRNLEVPDFLLKEADNPPTRPQTSLGITEAENRMNHETHLRPTSTPPRGAPPRRAPPRGAPPRGAPPRGAPPPGSGFATGTLPTHEEATALFGGMNGLDNISFGESLGSSGYPDSIANTSLGPGMSPELYRIQDRDSSPNGGGYESNYHPKISGISTMSEVDIPRSLSSDPSPGPLDGLQNGFGGSLSYDLDSTLTDESPNTSQQYPATAASTQEGELPRDVSDPPPPYSGKPSTLPRRDGGNNNYMKTLYEESNSSQNSNPTPNSRQRVVKKPVVAPKPQARRSKSLPVEEKVITVIGADGQQHRATFV